MSSIKIKAIPEEEPYLYAKVLDARGIGLIPSYVPIKFIITNLAVYIKACGVLIDISGTQRISIQEISTITIKVPLIVRYFRFLTFTTTIGKSTIRVHMNDYEEIINILTTINPNIELIDNTKHQK